MALEIEQPIVAGPSSVVEPTKPRLLGVLGPGLITGASDDDPSGIATYSQAGAQFGYALTWTIVGSDHKRLHGAHHGPRHRRQPASALSSWLLAGIVLLLLGGPHVLSNGGFLPSR